MEFIMAVDYDDETNDVEVRNDSPNDVVYVRDGLTDY
jgi:hypothetical protein